MYRHHPQTKMIGEMGASGRLGIYFARLCGLPFQTHPPRRYPPGPGKGGGSLWDIGVYPISYTQYLYGAVPQKVMAI